MKKLRTISRQMSSRVKPIICKKIIFVLLACCLAGSLVASAAHQPGTQTLAGQIKNFSENPRSQREEPKTKQDADKLSRRDGDDRHQNDNSASIVHSNLSPPELADNEYIAEDSTDTSTSPFTAEYETDASELMDLPNLQPSNLRHPFGQQPNHRPLRQSNNAMHMNSQLDQHQNQAPMMMMATQQQPRMQLPSNMGPVVSVVSSTMATNNNDVIQNNAGLQQQISSANQNQMPSRNVNGYNQLMNQQQQPQQQQQQSNQVPTTSSFSVKQQQPAFTTMSSGSLVDKDMTTTTESAAHELLSRVASQINERRLEMLYPSNKEESRHHQHSHPQQQHQHSEQQLARDAQVLQPVGICYSTLALLAAMLASAAVTVLLCCATHFAVKHLGRHQFDLIAKSNLFDSARGCGYLSGATADQRQNGKQASGMLSAFSEGSDLRSMQQRLRDEHGCAFDNPYFRDEATGQWRNQNGQPLTAYHQQTIGNNKENVPSTDQLNFIEHHISNLHNRQVTSSVKELSISGLTPNGSHAAHVVDLTSEEQRAKVIADPKEGDLIAVDITGHDFIGLGFDICGNSGEGIFIRSVLSRGPARESGCIQQGDRIKCINISFDNITLQDACDILNCGSPYKIRLLLEKRGVPALKQNAKQISSSGTKRLPGTDIPYRSQLLAASPSTAVCQTNSGPISATKSYLRRLASLVSSSRASNAKPSTNNYCDQFVGSQHPASASNNNQLLRPVYLGSAAARRRPSGRSVTNQIDKCGEDRIRNMDSGCRSDGEESQDEQPSTTQVTNRRRMSHSDSFGSNLRNGRFSVDSSEFFGRSSATDFGLDSSSDFLSKISHHRSQQIDGNATLRRDTDQRNGSSRETAPGKSTRNQPVAGNDQKLHNQERSSE